VGVGWRMFGTGYTLIDDQMTAGKMRKIEQKIRPRQNSTVHKFVIVLFCDQRSKNWQGRNKNECERERN
jgi:hypothetical protein